MNIMLSLFSGTKFWVETHHGMHFSCGCTIQKNEFFLCGCKVSIKSEIVTNDFDYCVVVIMYSKQIQFILCLTCYECIYSIQAQNTNIYMVICIYLYYPNTSLVECPSCHNKTTSSNSSSSTETMAQQNWFGLKGYAK